MDASYRYNEALCYPKYMISMRSKDDLYKTVEKIQS